MKSYVLESIISTVYSLLRFPFSFVFIFVLFIARQEIAFRESVRVAIQPVNKFVSFKSEKVNIVIDIVLHVV